jgi:hypothetical protein
MVESYHRGPAPWQPLPPTACSADSFGFEYDIQAQIPEGVYARRADLINDAEQAIFEAAGARVKTFAEVLALAA